MMKFIRSCLNSVWEGFLQNIGGILTAFVLSGGYLTILNNFSSVRSFIRSIPSDYFLTPLVLLAIALTLALYINFKQKRELDNIKTKPLRAENKARMVTHYGLWWKTYPEESYIEDFPYCPCCTPNQKLVQIEWHPDEQYKCPKSGTEYKIYDGIPLKRLEELDTLYHIYFKTLPPQMIEQFHSEYNRHKKINNEASEEMLIAMTINSTFRLCQLPSDEIQKIIKVTSSAKEAIAFIEQHISYYRKYLINHDDKK
ncbi:hypothetical protein [Aeromonas veronii]|uniref:hypothetical protein n=1 Tax=Aeromonas veronii TaxID=654 RepID=UPI0015E7C4E4|nr:hypothetical protein [Aeromonas veronii]HDZ8981970.1 hypothetical protein [Aeromonas veronii]